MALKLVKETSAGVLVEYWRISSGLHYDVVEQRLSAGVLVYVNEQSRRAEKTPVRETTSNEQPLNVLLEGAASDAAVKTGDPRGALYGVLKALPFFAGSEDC